MIDTSLDEESSWLTWGERDCWPFVRILIVAFVLGVTAHYFAGWTIDVPPLLGKPRQMLGILSILAMVSFVLAELYLLLFAIPLYILGVLNDWFYHASSWALRKVFRMHSTRSLAIAGLCGDIILFSGLAYLLRRVFV